MTASHLTFISGHMFMSELLNKPEVETLGPMLVRELRHEKDPHRIKRLEGILTKMDYPFVRRTPTDINPWKHRVLLVEALAEIKATHDGRSDQPIDDIFAGLFEELKEL